MQSKIFEIVTKSKDINERVSIKFLKLDIKKNINKINATIKFQNNKPFMYKSKIFKPIAFKNDYTLYLYLSLSLRQIVKNYNRINRANNKIECIYITYHKFYIIKYKMNN